MANDNLNGLNKAKQNLNLTGIQVLQNNRTVNNVLHNGILYSTSNLNSTKLYELLEKLVNGKAELCKQFIANRVRPNTKAWLQEVAPEILEKRAKEIYAQTKEKQNTRRQNEDKDMTEEEKHHVQLTRDLESAIKLRVSTEKCASFKRYAWTVGYTKADLINELKEDYNNDILKMAEDYAYNIIFRPVTLNSVVEDIRELVEV